MQPTHNSSECMPCAIVMPEVKHIYCMRTLTRYSRCNYKIGVTWVYNGQVFYSIVLYLHGNLLHLFHNATVRIMNSRVSMCVYNSNITIKSKANANFKRVINIVYLSWKTLTQLENPMFVCQPTLPPKWIRLLSSKDSWLDIRSDVLIRSEEVV